MSVELRFADDADSLEALGHEVATQFNREHQGKVGPWRIETGWLMKIEETVRERLNERLMRERADAGGGRVCVFGGTDSTEDFEAWLTDDVLNDLAPVLHDPGLIGRFRKEFPAGLHAVLAPHEGAAGAPSAAAGPAPEAPPQPPSKLILGPQHYYDEQTGGGGTMKR